HGGGCHSVPRKSRPISLPEMRPGRYSKLVRPLSGFQFGLPLQVTRIYDDRFIFQLGLSGESARARRPHRSTELEMGGARLAPCPGSAILSSVRAPQKRLPLVGIR